MRLAGELCRVVDYDLARHPLPALVAEIFGDASLERLHDHHPRPPASSGDQDTPAHQLFYQRFPRQIRQTYQRLLREVIAPRHDGDLCVQRVPTFRVHYPGAVAVREFHRDSDYHHQAGITNYWLPLTRAYGTNSIWIETGPGAGRYRPAELRPGQLLCFDAVRLRHGNHRNDTPATRVSFDFRVLPWHLYQETGLVSVSRGIRLSLGEYYQLLTRDGRFLDSPEPVR